MKEYFVEKPMPQFGKDIYSCIPIPNEIVAEIRADAIDEFVEMLKNPITLDALTSSRDRIKTFAIIKYRAGILKGDFKEGE